MATDRFDPAEHVGESVTFRGTARTAAGGAVVGVEQGMPVYMAGMDRWSREAEGRPVEVSGVLRLRESDMPPTAPGGLPLHGIDTESFVLDDARWALVSD